MASPRSTTGVHPTDADLHREGHARATELDDVVAPSTRDHQPLERDGAKCAEQDILQASYEGHDDAQSVKGKQAVEVNYNLEPLGDDMDADADITETCSCHIYGETMRLREFLDSFPVERDDGYSEAAGHESRDDNEAYCCVCSECMAEASTVTPHGYSTECDCVVCMDCMKGWVDVRIDENRVNIECPVHGMIPPDRLIHILCGNMTGHYHNQAR